MNGAALKYVDIAALKHLAQGLTYDAVRYGELIDHALDGLNAQTGFVDRMLKWIASGGLAAGPSPTMESGRVIIDIAKYSGGEKGPLHTATVLSDKRDAAAAPIVFINMLSPTLDIPMRTEMPLRALLVGNPPLAGTYTLYQHVLRTDHDEEYLYYGITKRGWNLRFSEHTRTALKSKSKRLLPRRLDELITARADARFGKAHDRPMLAGLITSLCAVGLSKEAAFEAEEYLVDKYSLATKHPNGLNMVPGGYAGIRFVQRFNPSAKKFDDTQEREQMYVSAIAISNVGFRDLRSQPE